MCGKQKRLVRSCLKSTSTVKSSFRRTEGSYRKKWTLLNLAIESRNTDESLKLQIYNWSWLTAIKIQNRQKMNMRRVLIIFHFFFSNHLKYSLESSYSKMFIGFLVLLSLIWVQIIYKYPIIHSDSIHFIGRQDIEKYMHIIQ